MKKTILVLITTIVVLIACSKGDSPSPATSSNPTPTPTPTPTLNCTGVDSKFSTVVSVIIQNSCSTSGCHSAGSSNGPGALTNFAQISASAAAIRSAVESGSMPKGSTLTQAQKTAISCWVASGAPNN